MKTSQCKEILEYIRTNGGITQLEALEKIGCGRLAARVHDIKHKLGVDIESTPKRVKNRKGKYVTVSYYTIREDESCGTDSR